MTAPATAQLITTKAELRARRAALTGPVVVVMTMGALHDGHVALVRRAREVAGDEGAVVVTDFVNPLQFGPHEDFDAYPRDLAADVARVAGLADIVFAPAVEEMYPVLPPLVSVAVGRLGTVLEGEFRPGHFAGVATVVAKLLQLVRPDVAVFGRKDAQQLALVQRLVADLDIPCRIEPVAIQREPEGLARSSRNVYLSATGREQALALSRTVRAVEAAAPSASGILAALASEAGAPGLTWNYAAAVDPATFEPIDESYRGEVLVVLAARVEGTRLLDSTVAEATEA